MEGNREGDWMKKVQKEEGEKVEEWKKSDSYEKRRVGESNLLKGEFSIVQGKGGKYAFKRLEGGEGGESGGGRETFSNERRGWADIGFEKETKPLLVTDGLGRGKGEKFLAVQWNLR